MRSFKLLTGLVLLGLFLVPQSKASEFDKKTILTFSQPVQIPGVILGAGTYVVKRADPGGNPDIVRFQSSDERHTFATVLTIPTERGTPPNKTEITFAETRRGTPEAIKKWWYPGETVGEEFIYPKGGSVLMARSTAMEMTPRPSPAPVESVQPAPEPKPLESAEPAPEPVETAQATPPPAPPAPAQAAPAPAPQTPPETLPQTASDIPLLALLGALALLGGTGLKAFSHQKS